MTPNWHPDQLEMDLGMGGVSARAKDPIEINVWPVVQVDVRTQRKGRYLPESYQHPGKMVPELARRIVAAFSEPGQLVVDIMAGTGTTVVEAAGLGRRAIGVELEHRWADLARRNIDSALSAERRPLAEVRRGDVRNLVDVVGDLFGTVDLICTSPPYLCDVSTKDHAAHRVGTSLAVAAGRNYGGAANLGNVRGDKYQEAMAVVYAGCFDLLRPGGRLVTVTKQTRQAGRIIDLSGITRTLAVMAGFDHTDHIIALHAAIVDNELRARGSFWQLNNFHKARSRGESHPVIVHEDCLVFSRPARQILPDTPVERAMSHAQVEHES